LKHFIYLPDLLQIVHLFIVRGQTALKKGINILAAFLFTG